MLFLATSFSIWRRALRGIGAILCDVIYNLISLLYQLFITVSRVNILSEDSIAPIYQRVTMILTIIMAFYITFEFVKYVIQPDNISDKEKGVGNLAYKIIVVVVLIAFVPKIFTLAYKFQNTVIENQVFSKVILGKKNLEFGKLGGQFSANMLSQFYYLDESDGVCKNMGGNCPKAELVVNSNYANFEINGTTSILNDINITAETSNITKDEDYYHPAIRFNGFMAIAVGIFILYILIMYSIDVGTRYAQLIFLQIIAPIAIMGYLTPKKDNMFQKWYKQCFTTYIDLFIRIAIIYFVLLLIKVLGDAFVAGSLFANINNGNVSFELKTLTYIVLVMGLLVFAGRAPKMLSELFPSMGSAGIGFGLGGKNRIEPATKAIKGITSTAGRSIAVAGAPGLAIAEAIRNKTGLWSAIKGTGVGLKGALGKDGGLSKSRQAIRTASQKDAERINAGGTPIGGDLFPGAAASESKRQDLKIQQLEIGKENKKNIRASVDDYAEVSSIKAAYESAKQGGASQEEINKLYAQYKAARNAMVNANATEVAKSRDEHGNVINYSYSYKYLDANGVEQKGSGVVHIGDGEVNTYSERTHNMIERSKELTKGKELENLEVEIKKYIFDEDGKPTLDENGLPKVDKDENGKDIKIKKTIKEMNAYEYAASIGDIGDLVDTTITKIKNSDEYRKAHANAGDSKK